MLKILISEDDFVSRKFIQRVMEKYGEVDVAVDGIEAIDAFEKALKDGKPYDLVCLDIMMPRMNGKEALVRIRELEAEAVIKGLDSTKVIMTTALSDSKTILETFNQGCEGYITKPIDLKKLEALMGELGLI